MLGAGVSCAGLALRQPPVPAVPAGWDYDLTSGVLPPVLAVSRGTTASRINSSGLIAIEAPNVARFDFPLGGGACRGLLTEPQRTNLCQQSSGFSAAPWSSGGGAWTANSLTGVDGTPSADLWSFADAAWRWYNVTGAAFLGPTTAYAIDASWGRIASTITTPAGCTAVRYYPARSDAPSRFVYQQIAVAPNTQYSAAHYARIGGSGMALDACQVEAGPYATSLIPTTGFAVTRDADVLTLLDVSRVVEITYLPLTGSALQIVTLPAGQQPIDIYGWITRVRQL